MSNLNSFHISDNLDQYEFMRDNCFEFVITDIDNLVKAGVNPELEVTDADRIVNGQEAIRLSVQQSSVPMFTQQTIDLRMGNGVVKAAGLPTFPDGTIVVNDYIGLGSKSVLMAWQALSYNVKNQTVGRMADYKKDCYLIEYDGDMTTVVMTWKLHGCFVSGLQQADFNRDQGGKRTVSATIAYDWAEPVL